MTLDPEPHAPYSSGRNLPPESNPLRAAALDYAKRGWPVLPLRPRDKTPNGLLVPHGLNDATTEVTRIEAWWQRVCADLQKSVVLSALRVPDESSRALARFAQRTMHLTCTIQESLVYLDDGSTTLQLLPERLVRGAATGRA